MDINYVATETAINIFRCGLMVGAYSLSKFYFKQSNNDQPESGNIITKTNFIRTLEATIFVLWCVLQISFVAIVIAILICSFDYRSSNFYIFSLLIIIPAIIGMIKSVFYRPDQKRIINQN